MFPHPGIEPGPRPWKGHILTDRLIGRYKSPNFGYLNSFRDSSQQQKMFLLLLSSLMLRSGYMFKSMLPSSYKSTLLKQSNLYSKTFVKMSTVTEADAEVQATPSLFDFELPSNEKNPNLLAIRHSTAHVMAMAVQKLFPETKSPAHMWSDSHK